MVSKCANPACSRSFHYFRDGKIFEFEVQETNSSLDGNAKRPIRRMTYARLCGDCAASLTVVQDKVGQVITSPRTPMPVRRLAASS